MTLETKVLTGFYWADEPGGTKRRGVRIQRGRSFAWIPDEDVLALAENLANYLAQRRRHTSADTTTNNN